MKSNTDGITVGSDVVLWDFDFRYNIAIMDSNELNVLMIKYEVALKRIDPKVDPDKLFHLQNILERLYKEVMRRNRLHILK